MNVSGTIVPQLQQAEPLLRRYLDRANLLDIEKERAMFLLSPDSRETFSDSGSVATLIELFQKCGCRAIFEAKQARAEDFRRNQGQGEWAEQLLLHAEWEGYRLVPFGPSDDIIPKEVGYEEQRLCYREFAALEGKRPDLLVFHREVEAKQRDQIASWQNHTILESDREVFYRCVCGIEVKSSLWHYRQRQGCAAGSLSITVKTEEWADIEFWVNKFHKPLFFVQAFVDEMYVSSYWGLKDRRQTRRGYSERPDPETRKPTSWFSLSESEPQIAEIVTDFSSFTMNNKGQVARPKQWPAAQLRLLKGIPELLAL